MIIERPAALNTHTVNKVVIKRNEYDEFVCKAYVNNIRYPPADYFTNDKQDAIETAKSMIQGC